MRPTVFAGLLALSFFSATTEAAHAQSATLRVSLKRVIDPATGLPSPQWTPANINAAWQECRRIFNGAGISLICDPTVCGAPPTGGPFPIGWQDWRDPGYPFSWLNPPLSATPPIEMQQMEQAAESAPEDFLWSTDAINIYLVNSLPANSGFSSFPIASGVGTNGPDRDDLVLVTPDPDPLISGRVLAHEIAHYLELYHTYEDTFGVEPATCGAASVTIGDRVSDTPPDRNQTLAQLTTMYGPSSATPCPGAITTLRSNLMANYWVGNSAIVPVFTPGQATRMNNAINAKRWHVRDGAGVAPERITSAIRTGTTLTLTGNFYYIPVGGATPGGGVTPSGPMEVGLGPALPLGGGSWGKDQLFPVIGQTATTLTVGLTTPGGSTVPPGYQSVCFYRGGDLAAFSDSVFTDGGASVRVIMNPGLTTATLRLNSSTGGAANMVVAVGPELATWAFDPEGRRLVDPNAPGTTIFSVAVGSSGQLDLPFALPVGAGLGNLVVQAFEADPSAAPALGRYSNVERIFLP